MTFLSAQIVSTGPAPDVKNTLLIIFDAVNALVQNYYFNQTSLFGDTFKDYPNGLRKDLAEVMYDDLKPRFLRWPGGAISRDRVSHSVGSVGRR